MQKKSFWLERIAKNIEFLDNFTRINTDKVNFNSIYSIFANQKYLRIKGTIFSTDKSPFISKSLDTFLKLGFNERAVLGLDLFRVVGFVPCRSFFLGICFSIFTQGKRCSIVSSSIPHLLNFVLEHLMKGCVILECGITH